MYPDHELENIAGFDSASIHICNTQSEANELIEAFRQTKLFCPQAVFFIGQTQEPKVTGLMLSAGCEVPIFTGGLLKSVKDILNYSMGFHLELYRPAEFSA